MNERFWSKVRKTEACWEWTASKTTGGYGAYWNGVFVMKAHRFSYELANGAIPAGMVIDHICRNAGCVNPDHLRAVTQGQNTQHCGLEGSGKNPYRGVHFDKRRGKWLASYMKNRRNNFVGYFSTADDAREAVIKARAENLPYDADSIAHLARNEALS